MEVNDRKEKMIEQLLRSEGKDLLSPDFKQKVMSQVNAMPAPELIRPRSTVMDWLYSARLMTTGEKIALSLALMCAVMAFIPGISELVTAWSWELSDMAISVTVGEDVLSASAMSVLSVTAGAAFMVAAGAYGAKQGMAGA